MILVSNKISWLATVDDVKTRILALNEDIFIPELSSS
ncbi:hypothetical protein ES703_27259 [subsurface metagenome]|jgi:hypothetical protein